MEREEGLTAPAPCLTFQDAKLDDLRAPEPYDVLLGSVATVRLESGGVLVYREDLFPIAELALALEDWLHDGLASGAGFSFDSVEHDEPGLIWCRLEPTGWRLGSIDQEHADLLTHTDDQVGMVFADFIDAVGSWLEARAGRELRSLRPTALRDTGNDEAGPPTAPSPGRRSA